MNLSKLIELLQAARGRVNDQQHISPMALIELVYATENPRIVNEYKAREQLVRDILKAKHQAGFKTQAVFFRDVWPVALQALKESRKRHGSERAALLLPGGDAQRDQTCVVIEETEHDYTIKPGAAAVTLHDGRRLQADETAKVPRELVRTLP